MKTQATLIPVIIDLSKNRIHKVLQGYTDSELAIELEEARKSGESDFVLSTIFVDSTDILQEYFTDPDDLDVYAPNPDIEKKVFDDFQKQFVDPKSKKEKNPFDQFKDMMDGMIKEAEKVINDITKPKEDKKDESKKEWNLFDEVWKFFDDGKKKGEERKKQQEEQKKKTKEEMEAKLDEFESMVEDVIADMQELFKQNEAESDTDAAEEEPETSPDKEDLSKTDEAESA
jgi:hypothetical protein